MVLHGDIDLLNPPVELEKSKHKLKRLVQVGLHPRPGMGL